MVAIRTIWICDDDEFGASKYTLYALFSDDIMASYHAEFDAWKYKLFALFSGDIMALYREEFDASKYELFALFNGDIMASHHAEFYVFELMNDKIFIDIRRLYGLLVSKLVWHSNFKKNIGNLWSKEGKWQKITFWSLHIHISTVYNKIHDI